MAIKNSSLTKGLPMVNATIEERLKELGSRPRRNPILHWGAFVLSAISLTILCFWFFGSRGPLPIVWISVDIGLGVISGVEFFTRSGFRWSKASYIRSRFFDFVAIIPALALVNNGFILEEVWLWVILVARAARVVDRLLGDGFVQRNILAFVEGFEEEITDHVLQHIVLRIQEDMDKAGFSHTIAEALIRNKPAVLQRVRAATPREGLLPGVARIVGLDVALERAEERAYDAVVGIMESEEVDKAIRDVVSSLFSRVHKELGRRSWHSHLGIRHQEAESNNYQHTQSEPGTQI